MGIINRIALIVFFTLAFATLLLVTIINVKFASIYLAWITEQVYNFLYGKTEGSIK